MITVFFEVRNRASSESSRRRARAKTECIFTYCCVVCEDDKVDAKFLNGKKVARKLMELQNTNTHLRPMKPLIYKLVELGVCLKGVSLDTCLFSLNICYWPLFED